MWDNSSVGEDSVAVPARAGRTRVIYVMGAGRSGSTILGVALGNCDGVFFAGELDRWFARAGVPRGDGARARFWGAVLERMPDAADVFAANTTLMERSSAVLDVRNWAARRRLRARYREVSLQLYEAIAAASGVDVIVDTSHYPLRARELQALGDVELHLLFLVRDPQSVVASLGRRDVPERRFNEPVANAYLWLTYLFSVLVFVRHPRERRVLVRHEQLLADPAGVVAQILERCGVPAGVPDMAALRTGVPFHGNRLIRQERVALEARPQRPAHGSPLTRVLQLPWRAVIARLRPAVGAPAGGAPAGGAPR